MRHAFVTGGAGFIGSHLVDRLLAEGWRVTVADNFDPFYPRPIKERNVEPQRQQAAYRLVEVDIRDLSRLREVFDVPYDAIVHLAAKAGVRPSIADPISYQEVNVRGTQNLLELAREKDVKQFVFASSSSVYGVNPNVPWREDDHVLQPISPYASTKVSGELLGHVYSHLYGIRFIGLRFFTVYGPRQRPDLAIHKFAGLMLAGKPIPVFGDGSTRRDYSYVDDIVTGIRAAMEYDRTPFEVVNLGNDLYGHTDGDDRWTRKGARGDRNDRMAAGAAGRRAADVGEPGESPADAGLRSADQLRGRRAAVCRVAGKRPRRLTVPAPFSLSFSAPSSRMRP